MERRKPTAVPEARQRRGFKMKQLFSLHAGSGRLVLVALCALLMCRCASTTLTSLTDGGLPDGGSTADAGPDAGEVAVILTIDNYQGWCTVSVEGDAGYRPMAAFVVGTVVQLDASPLPGYVWGYWTGTDGDGGSGDRNMATTVTMNTSKQVVACCPQSPPAAQVCPSPIP
jgi:Divergent InlB B-repeat domain